MHIYNHRHKYMHLIVKDKTLGSPYTTQAGLEFSCLNPYPGGSYICILCVLDYHCILLAVIFDLTISKSVKINC